MTDDIFKILRAAEWSELSREDVFEGSADDKRDGFIHLSFAAQIEGTLSKHFSNQQALFLLRIRAASLRGALRREVTKSGKIYPHLYRPLKMSDVDASVSMTDDWRKILF